MPIDKVNPINKVAIKANKKWNLSFTIIGIGFTNWNLVFCLGESFVLIVSVSEPSFSSSLISCSATGFLPFQEDELIYTPDLTTHRKSFETPMNNVYNPFLLFHRHFIIAR